MKKCLFLFIIGLFTGVLFAQNSVQPIQNQGSQSFQINKVINNAVVKNTRSSAKSSTSRWYNYGETMESFLSVASPLYGNFLFPDSTILVNYGTSGYGSSWIHKLGDVLDVTSVVFNDPVLYPNALTLDAASNYSLDSVYFYCIYDRNIANPNIVDTLIFEISVNDNLSTVYFGPGPLPTNLGTDTVFLKTVPYTYQTNALNLANKKIYKVPLTAQTYADSLANGMQIIKISTDNLPTVNQGKYVVTSIGFIPGYTWIANTDILDQKNNVLFISRKEVDNQFLTYTKKDFNVSYIVPSDVRYNSAGSWNGCHIPSFAYMGGAASTFNYEHHMIYYKVSTSFNITSSYQNVSCHNGSDGQINLVVSGGAPPYVYAWSNGATTPDISNLVAGTYNVTITDHDSASSVRSFHIIQPLALQATVTSTPASTCGASDGAIVVSGIQGGTPSYSIVVLNSDSITQSLTGLPAGIYTVKITDTKGCKLIKYISVNEQGTPSYNVTQNNISCFGLADGSIRIGVINPSVTPVFTWSNGMTTDSISNLSSGTYNVTITVGSCHIYGSYVILEPTPIQVNGTVSNATGGLSNGMIILQVSGGTSPYTYNWSSGQHTENIGNLAEGSYTVTVTDSRLCTHVVTFQVLSVGISNNDYVLATNIFPNPANDAIFISFKGVNNKSAVVNIYSIQGKLFKTKNIFIQTDGVYSIEIHNFVQGLYFAEIVVDGYKLTKKFIKN